ncbi:hypothetical protein EDB19DRAFT_2010574 [Suillus lakei]|nr:hypothetical protein EDB19DRAFT_2010574 [Suillus lakei]
MSHKATASWHSAIQTKENQNWGGCVAGAHPMVGDLIESLWVPQQGAHVSTGVSSQKMLWMWRWMLLGELWRKEQTRSLRKGDHSDLGRPLHRTLWGGTTSYTCTKIDSSGAKSPRESVKVLPMRSVSQSKYNNIRKSAYVPPSLERFHVSLIVVELNDLLVALPGGDAEEGEDKILGIFVRGLVVDAADVNLNPDEEVWTIFLQVAICPGVPLTAFFSAFALPTCLGLEFSFTFPDIT